MSQDTKETIDQIIETADSVDDLRELYFALRNEQSNATSTAQRRELESACQYVNLAMDMFTSAETRF